MRVRANRIPPVLRWSGIVAVLVLLAAGACARLERRAGSDTCAPTTNCGGVRTDVTAEIRELEERHFAAVAAADVDAVLATLHPHAFGPRGVLNRETLGRMFQGPAARHELQECRVLWAAGSQALVRVHARVFEPGPDAAVRELSTMQICERDENGVWRIRCAVPFVP